MSRALRAALLGYAALLRLYPRPFHRAFGGEMQEVFAAALSDAAARGAGALLWLCARELHELPGNLLREHRALWFVRPPHLPFLTGGDPLIGEPVSGESVLNLRPVYAGLAGGAAAAAALFLALCGALPLLGVPGWPAAPAALAGLGALLLPLLLLAAGYCAARWGWSPDLRGSLRTGALAGALAGLVAWLLVGSAGAGALGQAELLRYGARLAPADTMLALLSESAVGIAWATHLSFWGLAGLGAALGALGGWAHVRAGLPAWGARPRPVERAVLGALAGTALLVALFTLVCGLTLWGNLAARVGEAAQQSGRATTLPVAGVILLPCAALLAALTAALRALARQRAPQALGSLRARLLHAWRVAVPLLAAAMLTAGLAVIGTLVLLMAAGGTLMPLMVSGGLTLVADGRLFFALAALACAALALALRPAAARQLTPVAARLRSGADYLLLAWPVCAALVKLGVTAAASSLVSGPITLIGVLTDGSDPLGPTVPGVVQTLIGVQLTATLVLGLIPLLLLFCSSVYGALYRRWSAPRDLGWAG